MCSKQLDDIQGGGQCEPRSRAASAGRPTERCTPFVRTLVVMSSRNLRTLEIEQRVTARETNWSAAYAAHASELVNFLTKFTGDREVAAELMQETFVRAIRGGGHREIRSVRAWLFRVAGNLARDHHRRRALLRFVPFSGREPDPTAMSDPDLVLVHQA